MKFMLIMRTTEAAKKAYEAADFEQIINAMGAYNESLLKAGVLLAGEGLARDDVHRLADEELADLAILKDLGEEIAHLVDLAEALEHGGEAPMLLARLVRVREVVVEIGLARRRGDAEELVARRVDDHGAKASDLGSDVHGHRTRR